MGRDEKKLLKDCIARNCGAVLSIPSDETFLHGKSRFLAEHEGGVLIQAAAEQANVIESMIDNGDRGIVSFKNGVYRAVFGSRILRQLPQWKVSDTLAVDALLLEFPEEIKAIQRRTSYRARVAADGNISARVWRLADGAYIGEKPPHAQEIPCEVRDLSVGGIGVRLATRDGSDPRISPTERLRILLTVDGESLLLEGKMRQPKGPPVNGGLITGLTFKRLDGSIEGRQCLSFLNRVIGELQREELRQFRMGLTKPA